VLRIHSYDAYGREGAAAHLGRFGYAGGVALPESGLTHFRARAYDPGTGRWVSADPIGVNGGINLYGYAGGDPVNFVDPSGLQDAQPQPQPEIVVTGHQPSLIPCFGCGPLGGSPVFVSASDVVSLPTTVQSEIIVTATKKQPPLQRDAIQGVYPELYLVGLLDGATEAVAAEEIVVTGVRASRGWFSRLIGRIFGSACFTAGTLVDTATGLRPIETIKVGDLVFSRDEITGVTALKAVTAVTPAHDEPIVALTLETPWDAGTTHERIETTATHPWRSTKGRWIGTADLHPGDLVVRETGLPARVVAEAATGEVKATYNLTVADYHTFFVGNDKAWVHNACFSPQESQGLRDLFGQGEGGARSLLTRLKNGEQVGLPNGVTTRTLEQYRTQVLAIPKAAAAPVNQARLQAIDALLGGT